MALDMNRIRDKQAQTARKGGRWFKMQDGGVKNVIRVFKFSHKVTKEDVTARYFPKDMVGKSSDELDRPVIRHYGIADNPKIPVVSTPEIMKRYNELSNEDPEAARSIRPTTCYFLNILDINDIESGVRLYGAPPTVYNKVLGFITNQEYDEDEIFGVKGRDIVITLDKTKKGTDMYEVGLRKEGKSEKLPSDIQDSVKDLYNSKFLSLVGGTTETVSEPKEEKPKKKGKKEEADDDLDF